MIRGQNTPTDEFVPTRNQAQRQEPYVRRDVSGRNPVGQRDDWNRGCSLLRPTELENG
jgi:hypothetical protein